MEIVGADLMSPSVKKDIIRDCKNTFYANTMPKRFSL